MRRGATTKVVRLTCLLLFLCLCACGARRPSNPPWPRFFAWWKERRAEGDALSPLLALGRPIPGLDESTRLQALAWAQSFAGDYSGAVETFGHGWTERAPAIGATDEQALRSALELSPAVEALCAAARDRRILLLNEWHHLPASRAFGERLLPCLRRSGFDLLALEALGEKPEALVARGHAARGVTGFYTDDPRFGRLVDRALELGFTPVAYEGGGDCPGCSVAESIARREEAQAENLARALRDHPGGKIVVWVGFSHLNKRTVPDGGRWMAARLWEKTGIEPYSVYQLFDRGDPGKSDPIETALEGAADSGPLFAELASRWERIPSLFREGWRSGDPGGPPLVDAVVVHHRPAPTDSRAAWMEDPSTESRSVLVACRREAPEAVLLQLWKDPSRAADGVPFDQVVCRCGTPCELVAPAGRWHTRVRGSQGVLLEADLDLLETTTRIVL